MSFSAIDFHSHILPEIDDGAENTEKSIEILSLLKAQGVNKFFATPHFINHKMSIKNFIKERDESLNKLKKIISSNFQEIILGAEVLFEYNLCDNPDLKLLKVEKSDYIMLEIPFVPYSKRIAEEIEEIYYATGLKPIIAHIDRYFDIFSRDDYESIFSIPDVVLQVNNSAFLNKKFLKLLKNLVLDEFPVIFGSDAHDMDDRKPNFDLLKKSKFMRKMSSKMEYLNDIAAEICGE